MIHHCSIDTATKGYRGGKLERREIIIAKYCWLGASTTAPLASSFQLLVLIWHTYSTIGKFQPFGLDSNIDASIVRKYLAVVFAFVFEFSLGA